MFEIQGKYAKASIYSELYDDKAISQVYDLCNLEVFKEAKIKMMCDVHAGKNCLIGTTIYMQNKQIIPNLVGGDIGCGISMCFFEKENLDLKALDEFINQNIASGMKIRDKKHPQLSKKIQKDIADIVEHCKLFSEEVYLRSLGSLGGGNHFIEIDKVDEKTYALTIHTGSRLIGKKICEHFQKQAIKQGNSTRKEYAYLEGELYDQYMKYMNMACEIAKENRRLIALDILTFLDVKVIKTIDTMHNYIEILNDGIMIRKGAISAKKDEEVIIPINMKDGVIIAKGKGNSDYNYSANHGAGRLMSRADAKESLNLEEYQMMMKDIYTSSVSNKTLDEAPMAYKPLDLIIDDMEACIEIVKIVKPIYNFKAH